MAPTLLKLSTGTLLSAAPSYDAFAAGTSTASYLLDGHHDRLQEAPQTARRRLVLLHLHIVPRYRSLLFLRTGVGREIARGAKGGENWNKMGGKGEEGDKMGGKEKVRDAM